MKKIVLLAACLFVLSVVSATAAHETASWEYKIVYVDGILSTIQAELNDFGALGWELVDVFQQSNLPGAKYVFKLVIPCSLLQGYHSVVSFMSGRGKQSKEGKSLCMANTLSHSVSSKVSQIVIGRGSSRDNKGNGNRDTREV